MEGIERHGYVDRGVAEGLADKRGGGRSVDRHRIEAAVAPAAFAGCGTKEGHTENHALLEDEHYDAGDYKGCESLLGVAQEVAFGVDGHRRRCHRRCSGYGYSLYGDVLRQFELQRGHGREQRAIAQQQACFAI